MVANHIKCIHTHPFIGKICKVFVTHCYITHLLPLLQGAEDHRPIRRARSFSGTAAWLSPTMNHTIHSNCPLSKPVPTITMQWHISILVKKKKNMNVAMLTLKPIQRLSVPVDPEVRQRWPQNRCWHSSTSDADHSWQLALQPA